ncbi:hypothetical protein C5167_007842, partial [Papaver somniferum]
MVYVIYSFLRLMWSSGWYCSSSWVLYDNCFITPGSAVVYGFIWVVFDTITSGFIQNHKILIPLILELMLRSEQNSNTIARMVISDSFDHQESFPADNVLMRFGLEVKNEIHNDSTNLAHLVPRNATILSIWFFVAEFIKDVVIKKAELQSMVLFSSVKLVQLIPFVMNYNRTKAVSVNDGTYISFMFFMAIGIVLTLGISPPSRVVRDNGSRCTNIKYSKVTTEVIEILKLFLNWKMLLLVPASLASNFFYSYQFIYVNGLLFNLRTSGKIYGVVNTSTGASILTTDAVYKLNSLLFLHLAAGNISFHTSVSLCIVKYCSCFVYLAPSPASTAYVLCILRHHLLLILPKPQLFLIVQGRIFQFGVVQCIKPRFTIC